MNILMIEDDKELCEAVGFQLTSNGYTVDICPTGEDADYYIAKHCYDLIILDRMLPVLDGLSILQKLRNNGVLTPVIMVTAMNGLNDRIDGLDSGADDYLVKPFAVEELLARLRALARRPQRLENTDILSFNDICLDIHKQILNCKDKSVLLSKRETQLLEFFLRNHGQILTRELLLSRVWGADSFVEDGNLDNYIHFIRRRLKTVESNVFIKTIHSVGYCIDSL